MLRRQDGTGTMDRPFSRVWRLGTTVALLGLTLGVATLRGPARGGEGDDPDAARSKARTTTDGAAGAPFVPPYVQEGMAGLIAFRPAATFRRMDSDVIMPLLTTLGLDLSEITKAYQVIASKPGSLKLDVLDIEWVTGGIRFGRGKNNTGDVVHTVDGRRSGCPDCRPIRLPGVPPSVAFRLRSKPAMAGVSITNSRGRWRVPLGPIPACACSTTGPSSSTRKRRSAHSWAGDHRNHRPTCGGLPGSWPPAAGCSRLPSITRTERSRNSSTWDGLMMRWPFRSSRTSTTGPSGSTTPVPSHCTPPRLAGAAR